MQDVRTAELLRGLIESFGSGGVDEALVHLHPEILWNAPPEWLEQRVYSGHEAIRELASYWMAQFDDYRLDLDRTIELDDGRAVALLHQLGRIRESGTEVKQEVGWVGVSEDGLLKRIDVYFSWEATLEAAGVRS